ncbi:MAG TPA: tRNA pseudouridine(55) synthase TruB [Pyrinomonadaceae bacterium]|jgi:tRNA pseudouridine55 synthase|nr:tRNA pseudouridine(55) synthase TruB [Pyrinomonadaceae bacterium]
MDGLLIVDKPADWTSHDVVARARRLLREKRVGHTGTLDPFATGVLVLLVGCATRLAQFLAGAEKEYEATVRLGYATTTGDLTGARREGANAIGGTGAKTAEVINAAEVIDANALTPDCATLGRERLEAALAPLRGEIEQVPPMYSAKKVGGKKLYELARRGEEIERRAVRVRVEEFEIVAGEDGAFFKRNEDGTCDVRARVVCSAGTYVRALAESLGERLGTGAHLAALRRTRAGSFQIEAAVAPDELQKIVEGGGAGEILIPMEAALPHLPSAHLTGEEARKARHGAAVRVGDSPESWSEGGHVLMLDERGRLLAVGVYDAARALLQPRVMLAVEK